MASQTNAEAGRKVQTSPESFPVPQHGNAPTPQRRATLSAEGSPVNVEPNTPGRNPGEPIQAQPSVTAPIERTLQSSTPPPAHPEQAAELSEHRAENGELRQALAQRADEIKALNRQMEEMKFMFQAQQARAVPHPAPAQQRQVDPSQPVTYQQLQDFIQTVSPQMLDHAQQFAVSQAIRATWDVTQEEEQTAHARFQLQDIPEPERTKMTRDAVRMIRNERSSEVQPQASAARVPNAPIRPLTQSIVPLVEGTSPQSVPEPSNMNPMQQVVAEYERARQAAENASTPQEKKQGMAAMRKAHDRLEELQGRGDLDSQKMTAFRQRG